MLGGASYTKVVLFDLSFKGVSTDVHPDLLSWFLAVFFSKFFLADLDLRSNFEFELWRSSCTYMLRTALMRETRRCKNHFRIFSGSKVFLSFARNNKKNNQLLLGDLWSQNGWLSHKYHLPAVLEHRKGYRTFFTVLPSYLIFRDNSDCFRKQKKTKIWP